MLTEPDGVEAELLGPHDLLENALVVLGGRAMDLFVVVDVVEDPELHGADPLLGDPEPVPLPGCAEVHVEVPLAGK